MLHSPKHIFTLSNILYVTRITKPLLSVQKFCCDNHVYFEFHSSMFYVKDLITKEVLLFDQSNDGLYVLFDSLNFLVSLHLRDGQPMASLFVSSNPSYFKFFSF
jgi:hypothetical protein